MIKHELAGSVFVDKDGAEWEIIDIQKKLAYIKNNDSEETKLIAEWDLKTYTKI